MTDYEKELKFALFRLFEMYQLLLEFSSNPFYLKLRPDFVEEKE